VRRADARASLKRERQAQKKGEASAARRGLLCRLLAAPLEVPMFRVEEIPMFVFE